MANVKVTHEWTIEPCTSVIIYVHN